MIRAETIYHKAQHLDQAHLQQLADFLDTLVGEADHESARPTSNAAAPQSPRSAFRRLRRQAQDEGASPLTLDQIRQEVASRRGERVDD